MKNRGVIHKFCACSKVLSCLSWFLLLKFSYSPGFLRSFQKILSPTSDYRNFFTAEQFKFSKYMYERLKFLFLAENCWEPQWFSASRHWDMWAIQGLSDLLLVPAVWKPTHTELSTPKQKAGRIYLRNGLQMPSWTAGILPQEALGQVPRMHGSFVQKAPRPGLVASIFLHLFLWNILHFGKLEKRINWRPLTNGAVVNSMLKSVSQFLLILWSLETSWCFQGKACQ